MNQERRGRGLPSTSHSIRRDSVTFTVWLVRLRLYRGASRAKAGKGQAKKRRRRESRKGNTNHLSALIRTASQRLNTYVICTGGCCRIDKRGKSKKNPININICARGTDSHNMNETWVCLCSGPCSISALFSVTTY